MAAKYPTDTLENARLCCAVCLEQYQDPRTLSCSHTFCQSCIQQHVLRQKKDDHLKGGTECPLCRKITPKSNTDIQPEEWSNTLPVNHGLQKVIDALDNDFELCKICESKDVRTVAKKYCFQCNKKFCDDCEKIHSIFEHFQNHKIVRIGDKTTLRTFPDELDYCSIHRKPIEFYCIDENKLCCSSCAIIKHRKCNEVSEISDIAEKQNEEMEKSLLMKMRELKMKANNADFFYSKKEKEMDRQVNQIDQDMKKEQERVLSILKASRAKIMTEANSFRVKSIDQYKVYRSQCKKLTSSLDSSFQSLAIARQYGTPTQLFIALHKQEMHLAEDTDQGGTLFNGLKFMAITSETAESLSRMKEFTQKQCELKSEERSIDISEISDYRNIRIEKITSIYLKATNQDNKKPFYTGLEFLPDGRLVAVDNKNRKSIVMDEHLETLATFINDQMMIDVICLSREDILVSCGKRILKIGVKEDNRCGLTETINVKRQVGGISEYDEDFFVVNTWNSRKPVALMRKNGELKDFDIDFPDKKWKLDDSFSSFCKATGKLVVTDKVENKVHVYDMSTETETVIQDETIEEPRGVAFGPWSCFFVCSNDTDTVVQLSETGDIVQSLKVDMTNPYILCFSKDNTKLAITNNSEDRKLQLYKVLE